jgi:hypothetical protein
MLRKCNHNGTKDTTIGGRGKPLNIFFRRARRAVVVKNELELT